MGGGHRPRLGHVGSELERARLRLPRERGDPVRHRRAQPVGPEGRAKRVLQLHRRRAPADEQLRQSASAARPRPSRTSGTSTSTRSAGRHRVRRTAPPRRGSSSATRLRRRQADQGQERSWSGLLLANNAWRTSYRNLDINMNGPRAYVSVGVYLEHYSWRTRSSSSRSSPAVGVQRRVGRPGLGRSRRGKNTIIRTGVVDAQRRERHEELQAGVVSRRGHRDDHRDRRHVPLNQNWAGIGAYKNVGTNTFGG